MWHWQRPLDHTAECLGTVGTGTARQLVRGNIATPARPDCVVDHTRDNMWVIPLSNASSSAARWRDSPCSWFLSPAF